MIARQLFPKGTWSRVEVVPPSSSQLASGAVSAGAGGDEGAAPCRRLGRRRSALKVSVGLSDKRFQLVVTVSSGMTLSFMGDAVSNP